MCVLEGDLDQGDPRLDKLCNQIFTVLRIVIRDPVLFWPRGPGWKKALSWMNIPDHFSESFSETFFFG